MQYNLINNITPNAAKGSAIFGIFKGANISQFSYAFDKPELTKISNIIKSSSFQGEINESIKIISMEEIPLYDNSYGSPSLNGVIKYKLSVVESKSII